MNYVMTHWRGRQGLLWSFLVNGVAGYALAIFAAVTLFNVGAAQWHLAAFMLVFFVWFAWALVGTTRAGILTIKDPATSRALKLSALVVFVCLALALYGTAIDFGIMSRWLLQQFGGLVGIAECFGPAKRPAG
jgi:hypothetical protein